MQHLKSLLRGEAAKLVSHFNCTEDSYDDAIELLKTRYENKRVIFEGLVDKILDQPHLKSDKSENIRLLLDTTTSSLKSLEKMGLDIESIKPFIARVVIRKFDNEAIRQYEYATRKTREIQTLEDVFGFLEQMAQAQEALKVKKETSTIYQKTASNKYSNMYSTEINTCGYCKNKGHKIGDCRRFIQLNPTERKMWVTKNKLCYICLLHAADRRCYRYSNKCNICGKNHHTLLHIDYSNENKKQTCTGGKADSFIARKEKGTTFLTTALVRAKSAYGELITLRALVDPGSQETSVSEEAVQILRLTKKKTPKTELIGFCGTVVASTKSSVKLELMPRTTESEVFEVNALVLPSTLVGVQPAKSFDCDKSMWKNYTLADPHFNKSERVDIVIDCDLIHQLYDENSCVRKMGGILAHKTKLGWMLSGVVKMPEKTRKNCVAMTTNIEKFWEIEEIPEENSVAYDDPCIQYFDETTTITDNNRLVVRLPFEEDRELGNSRKQAVARFISLERRLEENPKLKEQYVEFMREYEERNHMKEVSINTGKYYLPHQAVIREDSLTTKLRVVFDASAKSSNKRSLNDILKVGPKLQKDIFDIIVKWRLWENVLTADVEKMYRQILVDEEDQPYQHILWRENKDEPIREFQLTTVTYGTSSAPFLAKKSLAYIGADAEDNNIRNIIMNDFYMDDLMTGADSEEECKYIQKAVTLQLNKFNFPLRKWMSNKKNILESIPDEGDVKVVHINNEEILKTLGLQWHPGKDVFKFALNVDNDLKVTKRRALSTLAKMFDPLGWLSPFTTLVKLFIQKLWLMKTEWDDQLDEELQKEWRVIMESLPYLRKVEIPRWYDTKISSKITVLGFADATQKAYAAVVYIKIGTTISLVAGKSKVNPVKNRKTLPKLELCAAHLLAKLIPRILSTIQRSCDVYAWSDSTIALAWIENNKNKDKFLRRRVEDIKNLLPNAIWNHVDSKENPADAASRGVPADKITELWWNGPSWLNTDKKDWPEQKVNQMSLTTNVKKGESWFETFSERFSSYRKLERTIAYVKRFIGKLRRRKYPEWLTSEELKEANECIVLQHQKEHFFLEIRNLSNQREVDQKSKIGSLHPFLDKDGILRVGGRIQNSELSFSQKHPVIIEKSWLGELLIKKVHLDTMHGGNNLVASILRREYWIIGMMRLIKKVIRNCVRCIRYRKSTTEQLMGNLPTARVTLSHPFTHTGVDYAGPIVMKCSRGRGQKSFKGYIAVFVCMTTKAIHLEPVSDLTTEAFLAALRRFFARRGKAACIYSDNGTNFIGAARKLDKEYIEAIKNNSTVCKVLAAEKIEWRFIPPASPHFGGIWEAGVKSVKHHLRRVIGDSMLTYEEMATLLYQIEAILNSRPLCSFNEDVDILTPGHFLIGQPLLQSPENTEEIKVGALDRWKIIQKMRRDFWQRWKDEYVVTLQHRYKWRTEEKNLELNQVVIIKDEATAPTRWPLGRIIEKHPGKDGKVRVVTLKTQDGILKRPIHKLRACSG